MSFFYSLVLVFTGMCIDGAHAIISKKNIFNQIGKSLGFASVEAGTAGFVTLVLIGLYIVFFVALAIIFIAGIVPELIRVIRDWREK